MVVVRIELWPFGKQENARLLGVCKISNDGTAHIKQHGNYNAALSHSGKYIGKKGTWKTGRVENHRRSLSPYHLAYKALKNCLFPKKLNSRDNYEDYSYYVGGEIMCKRMPLKFAKWIIAGRPA